VEYNLATALKAMDSVLGMHYPYLYDIRVDRGNKFIFCITIDFEDYSFNALVAPLSRVVVGEIISHAQAYFNEGVTIEDFYAIAEIVRSHGTRF